MSVEIRSGDRRRYMNELQAREKEIAAGLLKAAQPSSPKVLQENEKRMRREIANSNERRRIANSNERRRMQCINAGFSSLRALIPQLEGEKLSKAAILQHTTEYITNLEKEKTRLQAQLEHSKRLLTELGQDRAVAEPYLSSSPPPTKHKKRDTESSDEGVGMLSDASDEGGSELQNENISLRHQLETHKQQYAVLEDRNRLLEAQLLSLLQVQANHSSNNATQFGELHSVRHESRHLHHTNAFNRELTDVISSKDNLSSPVDMYQPPRPMSPTPERGMSMDNSSRVDNISPDLTAASSRFVPEKDQPVSYALKVETIFSDSCSKESILSATASVMDPTLNSANTDQHSYHHNYCHRDHPRRRHRQQAQLDQQREENARRQQDQCNMTVSTAYRPKHNTQNLENLVEAIRQIEGDRILCDDQKLYESAHIKYEKHISIAHSEESEKETSCISDQEEFKSESSGHDSPPLHHHHEHHFQHQHPFGSLLDNHQNSTGATHNLRNIGSSSEKYPIATHLLHPPVHESYSRPGVIVQKQ